MIFSPSSWLKYTSLLLPKNRLQWLSAMQAELLSIPEEKARREFAFGCFVAALSEWCQSRKGLNWIARTGGAALLILFSIFIFYSSNQMTGGADTKAIASTINNLGFVYLITAALLIVSLKALRGFSAIGLLAAISSWFYVMVTDAISSSTLLKFYAVISVEVAGIMTFLFLTSIYLNWLYSPEFHDT